MRRRFNNWYYNIPTYRRREIKETASLIILVTLIAVVAVSISYAVR